MDIKELSATSEGDIQLMSKIASEIVKDYYEPLLGTEQNNYMIQKFQSVDAIKEQLAHGYRYCFLLDDKCYLGFIAFYPVKNIIYLSKFYLYKNERHKGYGKHVLDFLKKEAQKQNLVAIELNVNKYNPTCAIYEKMGFQRIRAEKNDIGHGFYMDDYVYRLEI